MNGRQRHTHKSGGGHTLIEIIIVTAILAMIFMLVFSTTSIMTRAANSGRNKLYCLAQAEKAANAMSRELRETSTRSSTNYSIDEDGAALMFYRIQGYSTANGSVVADLVGPIYFKVEDGRLVRLEDLSEQADGKYDLPGERVVLCSEVEDVQFKIDANGSFIITLQVSYGDVDRNRNTSVTRVIAVRPANDFIYSGMTVGGEDGGSKKEKFFTKTKVGITNNRGKKKSINNNIKKNGK